MSTESKERISYIREKRKKKIIVMLFRFLILVVFLFGWELSAKMKLINTFIFNSPSIIIKTIYLLYTDGTLFSNIIVTLNEIIISFILSFSLSFLLATAMLAWPMFSKIISPYLTVLNSLPKVALGPLIIIFAGAGNTAIIIMGLLISIFVTTLNIYGYFFSTNCQFIMLMKTFQASKLEIFKRVIIPSNLSNLFEALKINLSMNYIGVITGELLVSKSGLGYLINYGSSVFHIDLVMTSIFILSVLSFIIYIFI